jgi:hypothetical protein
MMTSNEHTGTSNYRERTLEDGDMRKMKNLVLKTNVFQLETRTQGQDGPVSQNIQTGRQQELEFNTHGIMRSQVKEEETLKYSQNSFLHAYFKKKEGLEACIRQSKGILETLPEINAMV